LTCDAKALAVPAVVLMVSEARIFKDPPIRGSLPKADFAIDDEVSLFAEEDPPFSSGSSITPGKYKFHNFENYFLFL
jgi:hypothetical protein